MSLVDEVKCEALNRRLYDKRRHEVTERSTPSAPYDDTDEEDLIGFDSIAPGLPPASSDRQRWWLDNGQSEML